MRKRAHGRALERLRDGMRRAADEIEPVDPAMARRLRLCAGCDDPNSRCDTCEGANGGG